MNRTGLNVLMDGLQLIWKKCVPIKLKLIFFHFQFLCFDDGGPKVFVICCQKEKYS